jgi:hypothetical protein
MKVVIVRDPYLSHPTIHHVNLQQHISSFDDDA